jgi:hypothetical protein
MNANELIRGQGKLMQGIVELVATGKKYQQQTQVISASVAVHAHITGDIRPLNGMVKHMAKGMKLNSLRDYFQMYAPVKWSELKKEFKFDASKQVKNVADLNADEGARELMTALLNTPWWEMRKQEDDVDQYRPFDMKAKLLSIVKAADKALTEGDKTKETITTDEVLALRGLMLKLYPDLQAANAK